MVEPITKKRLMNSIHLRRENRNRLERLERLKNEELIPALRMGDGSQHTSGDSDRMANAVIRRMEYEDEIRRTVRKCDGLTPLSIHWKTRSNVRGCACAIQTAITAA